ncbi:MAG TPA: GTP 3',8-cyclase MoaA [Poseidonia sp.]|nr:GTP 3',8-cyclase MoaA [Poseidonia sp.]
MSLKDLRGRPLHDLRISVTDRCNFRCTYCMPREHFDTEHSFLPRKELLSYEEITEVVRGILPLGLRKIRLTGGEPLLRKNIVGLISQLRGLNDSVDIALTTNGALLLQHAKTLHEAGLDRVTVSLDAMDHELFQSMADNTMWTPNDIIEGILEAKRVGLGIKVNTVVKKGLNENQILPLFEQFHKLAIPLRFIEYMGVGNTNSWNMKDVVSGKEIRELIESEYGQLSPIPSSVRGEVAKRFSLPDGYEIGCIESVTSPFCGDCTRARLSANGALYTCLFASRGNDLKTILRMGATSEEVSMAIKDIWNKRSDRYSEERSEQSEPREKVEMSFIGG